ncbi:MAG TPA: hypothetical protein VMT79_06810 [Candidatus Binatia bacterium]|nr:hypothetical protein [Candidatus Binatia bacterium]
MSSRRDRVTAITEVVRGDAVHGTQRLVAALLGSLPVALIDWSFSHVAGPTAGGVKA